MSILKYYSETSYFEPWRCEHLLMWTQFPGPVCIYYIMKRSLRCEHLLMWTLLPWSQGVHISKVSLYNIISVAVQYDITVRAAGRPRASIVLLLFSFLLNNAPLTVSSKYHTFPFLPISYRTFLFLKVSIRKYYTRSVPVQYDVTVRATACPRSCSCSYIQFSSISTIKYHIIS